MRAIGINLLIILMILAVSWFSHSSISPDLGAAVLLLGLLGWGLWTRKKNKVDPTRCRACRYPLDTRMERCPECGLRSDGKPDPPTVVRWKQHADGGERKG